MSTDEEVVAHHTAALGAAREQLSRITDADLDRPTPCSGWDLRRLVEHMIGQNHGFAVAICSGDASPAAYRHHAVPDAAALLPAWDESAAELVAATSAAGSAERVHLVEVAPDRALPRATVVRMHLLDTVVHTWDVASSLGASYRPAPDLLDLVAEVAGAVPAGERRLVHGAAFAPPLAPPGTDPWSAALAFLGRDPRTWPTGAVLAANWSR